MKRSFEEKNPEVGIKALESMMKFVALMLRETTQEENGELHRVCTALNVKKGDFKQFRYVALELFSPEKTLKW